MATFKDRYEELFGTLDEPDAPVIRDLAGSGQRRAINLQDAYADTSSPKQAIPMRAPPTSSPGTQGAFGGLMKTGTATLGEALVGIPEYIARKNKFGQGVADSLAEVRSSLGDYRQRIYDSMDQDVIDMKGREFTTLDPDKTIWQGSPFEVGEALMYKLTEQIPMTLATLVPGGIMARAGMGAKAITYLGASEAGLSVGFIANDIADGIAEMSDAQLLDESPRFGELAQQYGAEEARRMFTAEAQGMAPVIGGLMVGAVSATAGRFLTPVFDTAGKGAMSRFGRGAISEGLLQEGPQESIEQIATNVARAAYDGDVTALDGVVEAYAQGAAVGGPMGGTFAVLAGRGPQADDGGTDPVANDTPDPADNQAIDLEAPWELTPRQTDMFGEEAIPLDNRDPMAETQVPDSYTQELLNAGVDRDPRVANLTRPQERFKKEKDRTLPPIKDASQGIHNEVDPLIAAAISANIRADNKMDESVSGVGARELVPGATRGQMDYEQWQGERDEQAGLQRQAGGEAMSQLMPHLQRAQGEPWQPDSPPQGPMPTEQSEMFPGGGQRTLGNPPTPTQAMPMPDELDMPSAEPIRDLKAQLAALDRGERDGVYLSAANMEGLNIDLGQRVVVENFDGKGGAVVFADQDTADSAQIWLEQGASMQEVLGRLTGAGDGKSMSPDAVVVQQLDDTGSVTRESQVANEEEAERTAAEWGGNTQILSQEQALARREQEIHRESQPDLFAEPPAMGTEERTVQEPRPKSEEYRVRFRDDAGATIEDKSFGSKQKATTYANKLVDEYNLVDSDIDYLTGPVRPGEARAPMENSDARITVTPIRKVAKTRTETVATEQAQEGREAPATPADEEVANKIRKSQSFDERGEAVLAVAGAETKEQAAEQLESAAIKRMRTERKGAISGFFPPDAYDFKDPQHEVEYSNLWHDLSALQDELDAAKSAVTTVKGKVKKNAAGKIVRERITAVGDLANVTQRVKREQAPILKKMTQLRQIAKPTRVAGRLVSTAKRAAPDRTTGAAKSPDKFDQMEGVMGEHEGEAITSSSTPSVEDQLADAETTAPTELKDEALKNIEDSATGDVIGDLDPDLTREEVDASRGTKLDILFEQALNYYRGRGKGDLLIDLMRYRAKDKGAINYIADFTAAGEPRLIAGDEKKFKRDLARMKKKHGDGYIIQQGAGLPDYNNPVTDGQKRKIILRVLTAEANQSEGDVRAEGVELVTSSSQSGARTTAKTRSTQALTSRQLKADESREDKIKREKLSERNRKGLERAVVAAAKRLEKLQAQEVKRPGGELSQDGIDLLFARRALAAQLQMAQSILQAWRSDSNMAGKKGLGVGMTALLNKTKKSTVNGKTRNVRPSNADLRGWYLAQAHQLPALTGWDKTASQVFSSNEKLMQNLRRLDRLERLGKNSVYRSLVGPVLQKLALDVDASFSTPQDSRNPMGIPQRVIDMYNKLRAEGRSHTGAVDNMADIGKLMPQLPARDFKGLYDALLIEWRRPSTYEVGMEGKAGAGATTSAPTNHKPTQVEMQGIDWALRQWRDGVVDQKKEFYEPVRKMLQNYGFEFDSDGNLIMESQDGRPVFSTHGGVAQEFQENRVEQEAAALLVTEQVEDQALDATEHVKAAGIFARFRKVVDHPRVTKNAMVDAELRMLRALKDAGFISQEGGQFATIRVVGFPDITYRKTAYDLRDNRINKSLAHNRMKKIRKDYTVAKGRYAANAAATAAEVTAAENPDYEYGFFIKAVDLPKNGPSMRRAANLIGDLMLNEGEVTATQVLRILTAELDPNSIYGRAADKLMYLADFDGVKVKWGSTGDGLGKFNTGDNTVVINKDRLQATRDTGDQYTEEKAVHVVLHEILHAATHNALRNNKALASAMKILRRRMALAFPDSKLYGLTTGPVDEFVTEMFVNQELQDLAKSVDVRSLSEMSGDNKGIAHNAWTYFKNLLKKYLGWEGEVEGSVFDVVMALEDKLFENAGVWMPDAGKQSFDFGGGVIGDLGKKAVARIGLTNQLENTFRKTQSTLGRGMMSLKVTSMKQLRKRYDRYFPDGSLKKYVDKFFERNARNAELMEVVEGLSKDWTKLHSENQAASLEVSRLGTESSLYRVNPTQSLTHDTNKHITSPEMKKRHAELSARYKALDSQGQKLWKNLQQYYKQALTRETHQLLLNALRAVTTMDDATFDKKYGMNNIGKFNTKDAIEKEFADFLPENRPDIIATIQRLASVPEMEQGVYFPLMRFGDYAVYSSRVKAERSFATNKEAREFAAKQTAMDPTYKVGVRKEGSQYITRVEEVEFVTAEEPGKIDQERQRLIDEYGQEAVGDVTKKFQTHADIAIKGQTGLQGIIEALGDNGAAVAAVKNLYLRGLADTSFRKREMTRKSVKGVDYDSQHRNFASYSKQSAYYTAQLEYGHQLAEALRDMQKFAKERRQADYTGVEGKKTTEELDNVVMSIIERDQMSADPYMVGDFTRKALGFTQFMMLTSASYHMINSSQPWMVTLPTMSGRHGWGAAFSAMKHAQKLIGGSVVKGIKDSGGGVKALWNQNAAEEAFGVFHQLAKNLNSNPDLTAEQKANYMEMLTALRRRHTLEVSPLTELREVAAGIDKTAGARAMDASRIMAHMVEVNNRVLTAIAAYDLELAKTGDKTKATEYASDMVSDTQFDYSSQNKPPLFQNYPLLFQFMQWSQHIYALLATNLVAAHRHGWLESKNEARKTLFGVLGTHAAVGGVLGVALQPIKMAVGLVALGLSDEDDPITLQKAMSGRYFDEAVQGGLSEVFGTQVSQIMSKGLPMAFGTDLSTRMSIGTLYFVDLRTDTAQSLGGSLLASFGGASVNQAMGMSAAMMKIADGDWQRGVEGLMPKFAKDLFKAGRLLSDGLVNNAGDQVLDTSDIGYWQIGLQSLGFTPEAQSNFYSGQTAMKDVERFVRARKQQLLREFRTASPSDRHKVRKEIRAFNRRYRLEAIDGDSLYSTVESKAKREAQYRRTGTNIDPRKFRQYSEYGDPYK